MRSVKVAKQLERALHDVKVVSSNPTSATGLSFWARCFTRNYFNWPWELKTVCLQYCRNNVNFVKHMPCMCKKGLKNPNYNFSCCSYVNSVRPGKNRQNGKPLAGKFCDLEEKNKEIHKGNPPTLEGNLPCWREILPSLQGNKHFFQACAILKTVHVQFKWKLCMDLF